MLKLGSSENKNECMYLLKRFYDESPYNQTEFDEEKVSELFDTLVNDKEKSLILTYEHEGRAVGIIVGIASEMLFSREKVCTELVWYVLPEFRGKRSALELISAYEYWATNVQGSKNVVMACLDERVSKLYERRGYMKQEEAWFRRS